jgi:hypothetical protein
VTRGGENFKVALCHWSFAHAGGFLKPIEQGVNVLLRGSFTRQAPQ